MCFHVAPVHITFFHLCPLSYTQGWSYCHWVNLIKFTRECVHLSANIHICCDTNVAIKSLLQQSCWWEKVLSWLFLSWVFNVSVNVTSDFLYVCTVKRSDFLYVCTVELVNLNIKTSTQSWLMEIPCRYPSLKKIRSYTIWNVVRMRTIWII